MPKRINPPLATRSHEQARSLRKSTTDAEAKLWYYLRARRLNGLKFRRQHPVPPFVVDFYCDRLKLVIELDGSQHNEEVDRARTRYLESQGLRVLRFWDNEVLQQTEAVLAKLVDFADNRTLTPTPLPEGEGLKSRECA